jgi:hypothetical protein
MDMTEGSETSEKLNLTPGKYPKENIKVSEHGENLKSRIPNLPDGPCCSEVFGYLPLICQHKVSYVS